MDIYRRYDNLVAKKANALNDLRKSKRQIKKLNKKFKDHEKARIVITEIARVTQNEIKERIEKLVTLSIKSVFDDRDFSFKMRFERKNNRLYAIPIVMEHGEEYDPEEDMGGGLIDIISLSSEIVLWHMEDPRKRNIIIIDEPFRFTGELVTKAGYMLKYISEKLDLQILMISHEDELINFCDRVYKVQRKGLISSVKLIKGERKIKRRKR